MLINSVVSLPFQHLRLNEIKKNAHQKERRIKEMGSPAKEKKTLGVTGGKQERLTGTAG